MKYDYMKDYPHLTDSKCVCGKKHKKNFTFDPNEPDYDCDICGQSHAWVKDPIMSDKIIEQYMELHKQGKTFHPNSII